MGVWENGKNLDLDSGKGEAVVEVGGVGLAAAVDGGVVVATRSQDGHIVSVVAGDCM